MQQEISPRIQVNKHQFYFETPLYELIRIEDLEKDYHLGDVDAYSVLNNIETTYKITYKYLGNDRPYLNNISCFELNCKRKSDDKLIFFAYEDDECIIKIGQIPSLTDLQFGELGKKYDKQLGREDLKLYKKAIGLAAHGVGAGSFVYLRRIFEKLILATFKDHSKDLNISELDFNKKYMADKVDILKDYLPSQLVSMRSIYSILSSGVHELIEEDCLAYFPALKLSIELILDQQIENDLKNNRDKATRDQIKAIANKIKSSGDADKEVA